ncbi:MAG: TPM domain-containing protein [Pirellulaceae bacterium]
MRFRFGSCTLLLCLLTAASLHAESGSIPPVPAIDGSGEFVHDLAGVLYIHDVPEGQHKRIHDAQKVAFEEHDTPIIVVTIHRMMAYGYAYEDIQPFAEEWFNTWNIGTLDKPGGHNQGILLLVSVGDRKGRIELGADWGRRFDGACQQIMDNVMIPHFKQGDYAAGIAAGAEALGKLAAVGPEGNAASLDFKGAGNRGFFSMPDLKDRSDGEILVSSMFSWTQIWLIIGVGFALICLGIFLGSGPETTEEKKKLRRWLVIAGVLVITAAVLTVIFIVILIVLGGWAGGGRSGGGGGYSGGSYSGGGFSGGSSGGGGASGSW